MSTIELPPYADELGNQLGTVVPNLVRWKEQFWLAKVPHCAPWAEMLSYRLAKDWLNVAAIASPNDVDDANWVDSGQAFDALAFRDRVLVRVAQDYAEGDLLVKDHDEAMAGELVFSTWIRRRDAHPLNRAYVAGIPIFFDHHIAYGNCGETINLPIETFFRYGVDAGHAGRWRLGKLPDGELPTTIGERAASEGEFAIHRICNESAFRRHVDLAVDRINRLMNVEIRDHVAASRVDDPASIVNLLTTTRDSLEKAVKQLLRVLGSAQT